MSAGQGAKPVRGVAAGVPFVAVPPAGGPRADAPLVVAWHLLDAPRTEVALAAALPLARLDAWRVYLGLPMTGARLPEGGMDGLLALAQEDAVLNVHGPVATRAAAELEPALGELRPRLGLGDGPVGLLGGSLGAAAAQLVLAEGAVPVRAAVLVSPLVQLAGFVGLMERAFGMSYTWTDDSRDVARRLDFVVRAGDVAAREPAVLLVVGADDDADAFVAPARALHGELATRYADPARVALEVVPGMGHALAEEPGVEAAPQTEAARRVDALAVGWLARHLLGRGQDAGRQDCGAPA